MVTLHEAQMDYIKSWKRNAHQHFCDGDYDWVASLIKETGAESILEIGCGVGYSTLALANIGIEVLSVDPIPEAITETKSLLESFGISAGNININNMSKVCIERMDAIEDFEKVSIYAEFVDLILICNPGGKLETMITEKEIDMLHWGNCHDDLINEANPMYLHKWAVLIAAARLAKENNKLLMIVDRGTQKELNEVLATIRLSAKMEKIDEAFRAIREAPSDGIQLSESDIGQLYWGAGLYLPKKLWNISIK